MVPVHVLADVNQSLYIEPEFATTTGLMIRTRLLAKRKSVKVSAIDKRYSLAETCMVV